MARDFSSDSLDGGDLSFLDSLDVFSFHVWVKPDTLTADMIIWEKSPSAFNDGITLFFDKVGPNATNTLDLFHVGTERIGSSTSNVFTASQWHSVAGYINWGSTGELFVDASSLGTDTFLTYVNNTAPLLVGMHNDSGDRRYWDGGIAGLTFWDVELTAQNITDLSNGHSPSSIQPEHIIRHWDIAGDFSPEPESIDGTDTLTVSGTTQITGPTLTAAVLTLPTEADITNTTAQAGLTTDQPGGELYYYVSTSATAPSATDLKAGTGAVFASSSPILPPSLFPFDSELIADADNGDTGVGAPQSVATDGTWYFVSYSDRIYTYNSSWVYQSHIDTSALNGGAHTQVNGMFPDGGTLYVTANEFPATVDSWVFEFTIASGTGALTYSTVTTLSAGGVAEAPALDGDGNWWICSNDKHGVDKYNSSWVHQSYYAFPAGDDPGTSKWQGLVWFDDYLLVNVHNQNANAPRSDVYKLSGGSFTLDRKEIPPPTTTSGQGIGLDGDYILWMDRESLTLGSIQRTTIRYDVLEGINTFNTTGLSAGTSYYSYFLQDSGFADSLDSNILESGVWATTGAGAAITGTAVSSITESDIVTGGKTIIITLTGDTWVAAGTGPIGSTADTQAIIDGLDSAQVEATGWNAEVRDKEVTTSVVRTSSTVCTITLTAQAGYDITAQETITVTVPAAALTGAAVLTGSPAFTVDLVAGASIPIMAYHRRQFLR